MNVNFFCKLASRSLRECWEKNILDPSDNYIINTYQFSRTVISGCTLVVSMCVIRSANSTEALNTSKPLCFENPTSDTVSKRFAKSSSNVVYLFDKILHRLNTDWYW